MVTKNTSNRAFRRQLGFTSALAGFACLAGLPGVALAQDEEGQDQPATQTAEAEDVIIVTGTLVRGIAPVGTPVVGITAEDVRESGATSSIELLADVPEVSNFFNIVNTPSTNFGSPANRPAIRDLPTLLLLNGYRLVGTGLIQTTPEPNQVAPGSIARVEVIPGSGSSIYGSDAIGGVINFITRRDFDGIELSARYGIGDDFDKKDGQVNVGQSWSTGSFFASYAYAYHDRIKYGDRPYYSEDLSQFGGDDFRGVDCAAPTIVADGVSYTGLDGTVGVNRCDHSVNADFYPEERRHNALIGLEQDIGSSVRFNATAYYGRRETYTETATRSASLTITDANPFFQSIAGETEQRVSFAYDPVFGPVGYNEGIFDSYGLTGELTVDVGSNWRVKLGGNYGHSDNYTSAYELNASAQSAAIGGTTLDTALNPYDLTQTNPAVLAAIANSRTVAQTDQNIYQARLVADGTLFEFNGNAAKLAVGVEYFENDVSPRLEQGPRPNFTLTETSGSRNAKSVFGELVLPVFGPENDVGGIYELTASVSGRLDDYSDFGSVFNPKFALTYSPFPGLRFLGNYAENYIAPALTDTVVTVDSRNQLFANSTRQRAGDVFEDNVNRPSILIAGGNPDLKPQTSKSWSAGFEFEPSFFDGMKLGATYYNIKFRNRIFIVGRSQINNPEVADYFAFFPTLEEARALLGGRRNDGFTTVESLYEGDPSTHPYLIVDARRNNVGAQNREGVDVFVDYEGQMGGITPSFGLNLTYQFKNDQQQVPGTDFIDVLENGERSLSLSAYAGIEAGAFKALLNHFRSGGYPVESVSGQDRVGAFDVTNLFVSYDLDGMGLADTTLSLNVDNLFDTEPPFINRANDLGRANGSTLGRVVTFGVSTRF